MRADNEDKNTGERGILWVAGAGLFLSTLDTGIMNIALPTLQSAWHTSVSGISWTVTLYATALVATVMLFGRWADRIGRLRIFLWGLLLFGISSAWCGAAPSLAQMIAARAAQGVGAAMVQATAAALVTTSIAAPRRNAALGSLAVFQGLGPIAGPSVGGLILSLLGWRWLFWANLPVGAVTILAAWRLRRLVPWTAGALPLNTTGNLLLAFMVAAALFATGGTETAAVRLSWILVVILAGGSLWLWERRNQAPIIPSALWHNRRFVASVIDIAAVGGATSLSFLLPPFLLERVQRMAPWQASLVNAFAPLGLIALSRPSAVWAKRIGALRVTALGLSVMTVSFAGLAFLPPQTDTPAMAALLFSYGLGAGLFFPGNLSTLMSASGQELQATLGSVQRMGLNLGTVIDVTVGSWLLGLGTGDGALLSATGAHFAWMYGALTLALALAFTLWARPLHEHPLS